MVEPAYIYIYPKQPFFFHSFIVIPAIKKAGIIPLQKLDPPFFLNLFIPHRSLQKMMVL